MGFDISKITLNVSLGDTSKTVASMNALIKTLESKKVKLEVDSSSLRASLSVMSSEIEKMYKQELEAKKKVENEKVSYTKQKNAEAIAYLKQQQSEIEKMYGVSSKLSFNQNPNTGQITSAIISYTTELGKAERVSYSLKEAITGVTAEGKKLGEIKLAPTNQNFTSDIVKINTELQKAQESLDKFKSTMSTNIANISVGKNGDMASQLQVFDQLKTKFAELQNMQLNTSNLSEYKAKINEVNKLYSQTKTKIAEVNTTQAQMTKSAKLDDKVTNKIKDLNQQLDLMVAKNGQLNSNPMFQKIREDIDKLKVTPLTQVDNAVKDIQRDIKTLNATTTSTTGIFANLGSTIKSAFGFMSGSMIIYQLASKIREIPSAIKEVDDAFVELQKVSDVANDQFDEVINNAYEKGIKLSATMTDYLGAMASINRGGYSSQEDVDTLSKLSIVMKNVSENMKDTDENATALIATMKGFKGSAQDAEHYVDSFNNISNNMAVTFDQLVDGTERISALMGSYGNSFNETVAMITAGTEIFGGDSERVATGIKTIAMNLAGIDEETGEEDVEYVAKMADELQRLAGIDITGANGELRNTFGILRDLAEVYPTLNRNEQAYLSQLIGKKTQAPVLTAILQNWESVEKAQQLAIDSAGSYEEEQSKYYESIQGHLDRLTASFQKFATTTLSTDFMKGIIEGTTNTLNGITSLIEACGGLTPIVISLASAFVALKVAQASLVTGSVSSGILDMVKSVTALTVSTEAATGATLALSAASKLLIGGAIVAGVMAIGYGINYVATSAERAEKKISNLRNEISEVSSANKSLEELSNKYNQLSTAAGLSVEEQQELIDIQNQLKEQIPELSGYYDSENNFILTNTQQIKDNIQANKDLIEVKSELLSAKQSNKIDGTLNDIDNYKRMSDEISKYIELKNKLSATSNNSIYMTNDELSRIGFSVEDIELLNRLDGIYGSVENATYELEISTKSLNDSNAELKQEYSDLITSSDTYKNTTIENQKAIQDAISNTSNSSLIENADKLKTDANSLVEDIINGCSDIKMSTSSVSDSVSEVIPPTQDANKAFQEMLSAFGGGEVDILSKALDELNHNMTLSEKTSEELASKYPGIFDGCETAMDGIVALNKQLSTNKFDNTTSQISSLVGILEDLEAGNGITASSFKKLSDTFPDLLGYMSDEATLTDAINSKMNDLKESQKQAYAEMLMASDDYYTQKLNSDSAWVTATENNLNSLLASLGSGYTADLSRYKNMEEAKAVITSQLISELGQAWADYFGMIADGMSLGDIEESMYINGDESLGTNVNYEAYYQAKKVYDSFKKISDSFANFKAPEIKVGGTKSAGSKNSSSSENYAKYIDSIYDSILQSLEEGTAKVDRQIAISQSKLENLELFGTQEEVVSANKELESLYKTRIDIMKKSSEQMIYLRDKMVKELQSKGYQELKGLDLTNISQLDLDKVISKLEKHIESANNSNDKKLAASLTYKKDLIEDYCRNIINANSEINTMAKSAIDAQNDLADAVIDNIDRALEYSISKSEAALEQINLEKSLLETSGTSDSAKADYQKLVTLNNQALSEIVAKRKAVENQIKAYRAQGLTDENEKIQSALSKWRSYESERLSMIKEIATQARNANLALLNDQISAINDSKSDMNSLFDLTISYIKQEVSDRRDALKQQVDDRKDALKEQYDAEKEALNKRLDLLNDEANAMKDALSKEKEERDYQSELAEKQKNVTDTQAKIDDLKGNTSTSAIKKRKELEAQLAKYKKELEDFKYDYSIKKQQDAIDEELKIQQDKINQELEDLENQYNDEVDALENKYDEELKVYEEFLNDQRKLREEANKLIAKKESAFYDELKEYAMKYTGSLEAEFNSLWDNAYKAMDKYGNRSDGVLSILESMTVQASKLADELERVNNTTYKDYLDDDKTTENDDYEIKNPSSNDKYNGLTDKEEKAAYRDEQLEKLIAYGDQMKGLTDTNAIKQLKEKQAEVAKTIGAYMQNGTYYIMINKKKYPVRSAVGVRHTGLETGEVGSSYGQFKLKSNEELNKLLKGEIVLNGDQTAKIMDNVKSLYNSSRGQDSSIVVTLDMHDFSITQDSLSDFEKMLKTKVPKIINESLINRGIKR